jgi:serine protein kinase
VQAQELFTKLRAYQEREQRTVWEGTFAGYLDLVLANPSLSQLSHARIYQMILAAGVDEHVRGRRRYTFFDKELFGLDTTLAHLVEDYFRPASRRLDVRKRILLLVGPVGGGKSTLVNLLKRGLEEYSKSDAGALYVIDGCPMHEEPLHLLPKDMREDLFKETGLYVEGGLCPWCRWQLKEIYQGKFEEVKVRRVVFSEENRVGVGTFKPKDPKSQDVADLTGSVNLNALVTYGQEADPRAYNFDGELNISNRGLLEMVEMLKNEKQFLYELNTVAGEQLIKAGRFAEIYVDVVPIGHTNEFEFNSYFSNKENEAMIDRMFVVTVPYNLRVDAEQEIYRKLVAQSDLRDVHVAPYTYRIVSIFAILSRLIPSKKAGVGLMTKLRLYAGEDVGDFKQKDVKELREEYQHEGMEGVSPRFVITRLSAAIVKDGTTCLNPIDALRALRDGVHEIAHGDEERKRLLGFIDEARKEYDETAKKEVQKAFVYSYDEAAHTLLNNYLDNVEGFCNSTKLKDPITDEEMAPDEKLMRSIEEQIGVTENAKKEFRDGILKSVGVLARKGKQFTFESDERLKQAIEKKLFADLRDVVKITTSSRTPDAEQLKRINSVVERLTQNEGYCTVCANELVKYVGALLSR